MRRDGCLSFTLRPGERFTHIPAHLDCLSGAGRPASYLDGGAIDRVVQGLGGGCRARAVFHAQHSLGRPGQHHQAYNDDEERLGLSRTYQLEIGETERTADVVDALRSLALIEDAAPETLAVAPLAAAPAVAAGKEHMAEPWRRVHADEALEMEPGDERVVVSTLDTGIVVGHPELQRKCLAGYDTVDLGVGWVNENTRLVGDSRGRDYNPYDEVGHGCLVAGIIGAQGWRVPRGVGGRCLLLAVRVLAAALGASPCKRIGVGGLSDIDAGLKVAVDLGGMVLNMSLGTPESSLDPDGSRPHQRVVRYAAEHGCVLVAAAGNSGKPERYYPAALPEVIAVGSVDEHGNRSSFSTWGEHLALAAPGERIVGVGRQGYQINSGTSFAAPFVSGVAALILARARRRGRTLDGAAVKRILTRSSTPLGAGGFSAETGHGLLNAAAALRATDEETGRPV